STKQFPKFSNWYEAFYALEDYLSTLPSDRKRVVFIDEMPWIDAKQSKFVSALENFWNGWAMSQRNIMLIATGSASSWMKDKIVANRGGLHARITCNLHLSPFTLNETERYLVTRGIEWDRYQITQSYMVFGGVPFYYSLLDPSLSLVQNIDRLFFNEGALLKMEFDELYNALFDNADLYVKIVQLLSEHESGLTSKDIFQSLASKSSNITKVIKNLERSDMIERWNQYGNKRRGAVYRLIDFFSLFYFKFLANNFSHDEEWWSNHLNSGAVFDWMGNSFEIVCMRHHNQIKSALGIRVVATSLSTWHVKPDRKEKRPGGQIDLIIERADRIIHLCEIKFCTDTYQIKSDYERKLRERAGLFRALTKTNKALVHTFITTFGVANAKNRSIVHSEVVMDDLFNS
ncbi:MAG: ATP-binding protein, partial [Prevotella sp.]|nr:ATP-binding protein [Prevotella sp.]